MCRTDNAGDWIIEQDRRTISREHGESDAGNRRHKAIRRG
jgi:hypothetical protein